MFYTITNLQGSQTKSFRIYAYNCFTPLQTYKVLKRRYYISADDPVLHHYKLTRFSNSPATDKNSSLVLHHYKLTRFSNIGSRYFDLYIVLHHYKLTRFSNTVNANSVTQNVLHHYKLTRFSNTKR